MARKTKGQVLKLEPGSGIAKGSVGPGGAPSGHYWDRLEDARGDKAKLDALMDELESHGYSRDGQLYNAALSAYNDTGSTRRRTASKRTRASQSEG